MKPKFTSWKIEANGQDVTRMYGRYIQGIEVAYKTNSIPMATLQIASPSYFEDIFETGMEIKIFMGFDRNNIEMFKGKVVSSPNGRAENLIRMTVKLLGETSAATKNQKTRVFKIPKISAIVQQIAAENGYTPIVVVANDMIDISDLPIQNKQTDLQFINQLAEDSNCIWWTWDKYFYFYDSDLAHSAGDLLKKPDIYNEDLSPIYKLAYRTDLIKNNVASIEWKFKQAQGSAPGQAAVKSFGETGEEFSTRDYETTYQGVRYRIKPEIIASFKSNKEVWKYLAIKLSSGVSGHEDFIKQYMKPIPRSGKIHEGKNYVASHKMNGMEAMVMLNQGDPALRPPRTCSITDGTKNPSAHSSFLPDFLMSGVGTTRWFCNEVTTSLQNGMINTKLKVTR